MSASFCINDFDFAFFLKPVEHLSSVGLHFVQVWPTLLKKHTHYDKVTIKYMN